MFFLFKQRTAYELRISDWSSDVCSSDLRQREAADAEIVTVGAEIFWHVDAQRYVDLEIRHQVVEWLHAGQQWQLREAERQQDRVRQFQPATERAERAVVLRQRGVCGDHGQHVGADVRRAIRRDGDRASGLEGRR